MCLVGVVVRRYIDYLIQPIPTPLVSVCFSAASLLFVKKKSFSFFFSAKYKHIPATTGVPRQPYEGVHIIFYTRRSTHKRTLHILQWTSAVCLQGAGCRSRS